MTKFLRNSLWGGAIMLLALASASPAQAEEETITFDLTNVSDMQSYAPEVPDFDNWTADGSNKYYSISELKRGKVSISLGGGSSVTNRPRLYGTATLYDLRVYNTDWMKLELPENCILQKISITCNSTTSAVQKLTLESGQPGGITYDNKIVNWNASTGNNASSVTFSVGGTIRITTIDVTYEDPGAGQVVDPEYYIVGDFNNWDPSEQYKMTDEGGSWTLKEFVLQTGAKFQIYDAANFKHVSAVEGEEDLIFTKPSEELELSFVTGDVNGNSWVIDRSGSYNITLLGDGDDMLVVELIKYIIPVPQNLYFFGDVYAYNGQENDNGWNAENPLTFSGQDGVFTLKGVQLYNSTGSAYFSMTNQKGSWDIINGNSCRYIPESNANVTVGNPVAFTLGETGTQTSFIIPSGVYDFTVDFNELTITATVSETAAIGPKKPAEAPEALYLIGNVKDYSWNVANPIPAELIQDGIFKFYNVTLEAPDQSEVGYLSFINTVTTDWAILNDGSHRYGPFTTGELLQTTGSPIYAVGDVSWTITPGTYDITVNFNTCEVTYATATPVEGTYTVYAYNDTYWEDFYLYTWGVGEFADAFPGTEMTETETINDVEYLKFSFTANKGDIVNLIFNKGNNEIEIKYEGWVLLNDAIYLEVSVEGAEVIDPETYEPPTAPVIMAPYTIYVYNQTEWDDVYLYISNDDDVVYTEEWPGDAPKDETVLIKDLEYMVYIIELPEGSTNNLIFNNGDKVKLNDLSVDFTDAAVYITITDEGAEIIDPDTYEPPTTPVIMAPYTIYVYNQTEWNDVYLYIYNDNDVVYTGDWPGDAPEDKTEEINELEYMVYIIELPEGSTNNLIFNNGEEAKLKDLSVDFTEEAVYITITEKGAEIIDPATFKPSGIKAFESLNGDEVIYNLQGVRVSKDHLNKGIYVINGRKVMVK